MALEDQVSDLVSAVNKLVGTQGNSAPSAAGGNAAAQQNVSWIANAAKETGNLAKETVPLIFGFKRLTEGSDVTSTALHGFAGALKTVGLSSFGGLVGAAGEEFLKQKTNLDALNKETGAAGLNIGRYVRMAGEAGLTTQQFNEAIKTSNGSLMGLGLNSSHSAEVFSKVNRELIQSEIGGKLMQAGVSSEEMAHYTAISLMGMRRRDLTTAEGQAAIQKSAASLSQTLLESSIISGQNRDAMAKNLQAELEDTDNIVEMSRMSEEQRNAYIAVQDEAQKVGPSMGKLVTEIYNNQGLITDKGIAMVQAMGPAGQAMNDHIVQLKRLEGQTGEAADAQRNNLKKQIEQDQARGLLYIQQDKSTSKTMTEAQAAARNELIQGAKGYFNNLTNATRDSGGDMQLALEKMKTDARYQTQAKTSTGEDDAGARITVAMNEANHRATIQAGGMANAFERATDIISSDNKVIGVMRDSLDIIGRPGGKMDQAADKFLKYPETLTAGLKSIASGGKAGAVSQPTTGLDAAGNIIPKDKKTGVRSSGTLAETGSVTEPEDALVKIHKGETVFDPAATQRLGKQLSTGGINIAEISKTISTSISSVLPGADSKPSDADKSSPNLAKSIEALTTHIEAEQAKASNNTNGTIFKDAAGQQEVIGLAIKGMTDKMIQEMLPMGTKLEAYYKDKDGTLQSYANDAAKKLVENQKYFRDGQVSTQAAEYLKVVENEKKFRDEFNKNQIQGNAELKTKTVQAIAEEHKEKDKASQLAVAKVKEYTNAELIERDKLNSQNNGKIKEPEKVDRKAELENMFGGIANKIAPEIKKAESKSVEVANKQADLKKDPNKMSTAELAARDAAGNDTRGSNKAPAPAPAPAAPVTAAGKVELKDLNDQLSMLNKQMHQLISYNAEISDHTKTTARAKAAGQRT